MCHAKFEMDFGPKINFIIGQNGSGKSAILTAITIGLGGKATSTQRGNSLKCLVKNGAHQAEIRLKIRNRGVDSFKHSEYGDYIWVIRKISKEGGGSYMIKNEHGHIVSKKKEELAQLCDHMAIQPDNPVLILSQDAAKEFLASSSPEERYKLFMKGTQLEQLQDDYNSTHASLKVMKKALKEQEEEIPSMKEVRDLAKKKLKRFENVMDVEQQIGALKKQIAWSQYYDKERELDDAKETRDLLLEKISKATAKIKEKENEFNNIEREIAEKEKILEDQEEKVYLPINHKKQNLEKKRMEVVIEKDAIQGEIDEKKKERNDCMAESRKIESDLNKYLAQHDVGENEKRKVALDNKIKDAHSDIKKIKHELEEANHQLRNGELQIKLGALESSCGRCEHELSGIDYKLREVNRRIQQLQSSTFNRLVALHRNASKLVDMIERESLRGAFKGMKPVGPLGQYLSLKNNKYIDAIDAHINPTAALSFVVSDQRDVETLRKLCIQSGYHFDAPQGASPRFYDIYCTKKDTHFDYSRGLPPPSNDYKPMIDLFEFEDDLVKQLFVNLFRVESVIVVSERIIGERVMSTKPRNVMACYDINANKIGNAGGRGGANFAMKRTGAQFSFGKCIKNRVDYEQTLLDEKLQYETERRKFQEIYSQAKQEYENVKQTITNLEAISQNALHQIRNLEEKIDEYENEISVIEQVIQESQEGHIVMEFHARTQQCEEKMKLIEHSLRELAPKIQEAIARYNELSGEMNKCSEELEEEKNKFKDVNTQYDSLKIARNRCKDELQYYNSKMAEYRNDCEVASMKYEEFSKTCKDLYDKAFDFCDGEVVEKDLLEFRGADATNKIATKLHRMQARLAQSEENIGSFEEASLDFNEKNERYEKAVTEFNAGVDYVQIAEQGLVERRKKWDKFRKLISVRAAQHFRNLLQKRNYDGNLIFDHENKKLEVKVRTVKVEEVKNPQRRLDSYFGKKSKKEKENTPEVVQGAKDARNLSGGEKSFSTICLLLSLWEAMSCKIRGLDEFDVFMDSVNRKIAVSLIIDTARGAPETQHILITPQAMNNLKDFGKDVKIKRLEDPRAAREAGQTRLGETN